MDDFKEACFQVREILLECDSKTRGLRAHHELVDEPPSYPEQHSEMVANVMLALRHIEDARMRLGKAIQAYDGGTSCYPR